MKQLLPMGVMFVVGVVVGVWVPQTSSVTVTQGANIVNVAQLVLTAFIAVYAQHYFTRLHAVTSSERELLAEYAKDALIELKQVRALFSDLFDEPTTSPEKYRKLLLQLRAFANSLELLEKCLHECHPQKASEWISKPKNLYFDYKAVLSGGKYPGERYPLSTLNHEERIFRDVSASILALMFAVNRAR